MTPPRPPALAEWLLALTRRSPDHAYLSGDLAEGFQRRALVDPRAARRWYWSQVIRSVVHRPPAGRRTTDGRRPARAATLLREAFAARRILRRHPGLSLLSIATIVVGVTATSTLFTVAYSILYRPLPWPDASRLVRVWESRRGGTPIVDHRLTSVVFDAWHERMTTVDALEAYNPESVTMAGTDGAERVQAAQVTAGLLPLVGARPASGRLFANGDDHVAIVSSRLAERQFGAGKSAVGRTLQLSLGSFTVVGVLGATFAFPSADTDIWMPMPSWTSRRPSQSVLAAIARLAPGVTPDQAATEAEARAAGAPPLDPAVAAMLFGRDGPVHVEADTMLDLATRNVKPALLVLLAAVALLMLTAMASLAGLHAAESSYRRRELAIRAALGAGRGRLAAQLVAEALWISAVGGAGALVATRWVLGAAPAVLPPGFPRVDAVVFDAVSLAALLVLTLVTALVVGLLPAWHASRLPLAAALAGTRVASSFGARPAAGRSRRALIAGQMAVAVVLLVAAGLIGRSFVVLVREDLGYEPSNLLVARLIGVGAARSARVPAETLRRLVERLEHLPGVTGVAMSTALPFQKESGRMTLGFTTTNADGTPTPAQASENDVTPSYFDLMGMRLVEGRLLEDGDRTRGPRPPVVVNEAFARAYLGERRLGPFANGGEVVGIVQDIRDRGSRDPVDPQIFTLYSDDQALLLRPSAVYIRTAGDPLAAIPLARAAVRQVDARLGLDNVTTMSQRLNAMVAGPRLYAVIVSVFALLALVVAAIGLFGVLAFSVSRRTREIGVRGALGASPSAIARAVLGEGLLLSSVGIVAGLGAAAVSVRYLASILYGVSPYDGAVFTLVPLVLLAIAGLACFVPAQRAARVDPVVALRAE